MRQDSFVLSISKLEELGVEELYEILALRQEVFVVEQNCVYQDLDGLDHLADHISLKKQNIGRIIAYARVFAPGTVNDDTVVIGRVLVKEQFRKMGLGKKIMEESIAHCKTKYIGADIKISAQTYLNSFYTSLGFEDTGDHYLEDGIPHMAMVLKAKV